MVVEGLVPVNILGLRCLPSSGVPYGSLNDLYDISYDYDEAENIIGKELRVRDCMKKVKKYVDGNIQDI